MHKPYALRRAHKRGHVVFRYGRFFYCQDCGRRMTASNTARRFGVRGDELYCEPCATVVNGGPIKRWANEKVHYGDLYL